MKVIDLIDNISNKYKYLIIYDIEYNLILKVNLNLVNIIDILMNEPVYKYMFARDTVVVWLDFSLEV